MLRRENGEPFPEMKRIILLFPPALRWVTWGLSALCISAVLCFPAAAQLGIDISVGISPPALPVYEQPMTPAPGYLWTPGYWAWNDDDGYYWVPGTWVLAPMGMVWTPGYWAWNDGVYKWNNGYWGPHVGFYGGINYGFGYDGVGFFGGEWRGNTFFYNTAVVNVNPAQITHVYHDRRGLANNSSHAAFNGGQGGIMARPTPQEQGYSRESHVPPLAAQTEHEHAASQNRALFASENHGRPTIAATAKPGQFSGAGVVAAKAAGAPYHAPALSSKAARAIAPRGRMGTPKGINAENRALTLSNAHPASNNKKRPTSVMAKRQNGVHLTTPHLSRRPIPSHAANVPPQKGTFRRNPPRAHFSHLAAPNAPTVTHRAAHPRPAPAIHRAAASRPAPAPHRAAPRPRTAPPGHRALPAAAKQGVAPQHKDAPR